LTLAPGVRSALGSNYSGEATQNPRWHFRIHGGGMGGQLLSVGHEACGIFDVLRDGGWSTFSKRADLKSPLGAARFDRELRKRAVLEFDVCSGN
jgi:hypothetical protein